MHEQKLIVRFGFVTWLIGYLLPGLDHRFGWSHLPLWLAILSQAFFLGGCLMVFWVVKANSFAVATIRVEPDQKVISSGPYRIVRHPMYLGASVMFLFAPLALGSYFALPVFALFIPIIVFRLLNEGKVLRQELPGYAEYCLHTRFRLVPLFWLSPPLRTLTCGKSGTCPTRIRALTCSGVTVGVVPGSFNPALVENQHR
ncbi:MAG: isoprenylcysteine carboxylmethyltransferase family protein [Candidatus Sulfotelmatobacter sp.]